MEAGHSKQTLIHSTIIGKVYRYEDKTPLGTHVWYGFEAHDGSSCSQGQKLEYMMARADGNR